MVVVGWLVGCFMAGWVECVFGGGEEGGNTHIHETRNEEGRSSGCG